VRLRNQITLVLFCLPLLVQAQPKICFFGDSITEGWMDAERHSDQAYPAILDSMLTAAGVSVESIVTARGGETTEDALDRMDTDVLSVDPDVIVLAYGSNDYFVWGYPPASRVPRERFRLNCRILLEKCTGTGSHVIVLAPPPVMERRFYQYFDSSLYAADGGVGLLRSSYADILAEVSSELPTVRYVRLDSIFNADSSLLGFDGVHPTAAGHRRIAAGVLPTLMNAVLSERDRPAPLRMLTVYPSPFHRGRDGRAVIGFTSGEAGEHVLRIMDSAGRQVRKIVYYAHTEGNHSILWNGQTDDGTMAAAGAYTLFLQSASRSFSSHGLLLF